jgi:hypothetical protein
LRIDLKRKASILKEKEKMLQDLKDRVAVV